VDEQLESWFHKNDFVVNTTKTAAMSFYLSHSKLSFKPPIFIRNMEIHYKSEVNFLRMSINENLSWHAHICSLCHSLSKTFFIVKSIKNTLSSHVHWNIYFAYFQSSHTLGGGGGDKKMQKKIMY
jgi:hypothetical protein